ncbi:MAG TPA: hypothetical protein RMH80_06265, partial [Polyangiaceae bacterium LLY-WYZ-15_(1-7)]|nr:hypothetical protein [Polyangiaceae bacterium LLY-WYZ-15_(1-7)]
LLFLAGLMACRGSGGSSPGEIDPEVEEVLRLSAEYTPYPAGCARPEVHEGTPVVALRWRRELETYLPLGSSPSELALDYEVHPAPHVDRVDLHFDFDALRDAPPIQLDEVCPERLGRETWTPEVEDVVRVVVEAGDERTSRRGELFFAQGPARVELMLPERDEAEGFFVLYEPAAGLPRVVVQPVEADATSILLDGLPAEPGLFALVRVPELSVDQATGVTYAPSGFAREWMSVTRYLAAATWDGAAESIALEALWRGERIPGAVLSTELAALTPEETTLWLFAAPVNVDAEGDVSTSDGSLPGLPCDARVQVGVWSFGSATARLGDEAHDLSAGETATLDVACAPGEETAPLGLTTRSLNGREVRVFVQVLSEGGAS